MTSAGLRQQLTSSRLNMSVLLCSIEGRTGFGYFWKVTMAKDLGSWVLGTPLVQDLWERVFLALRAIVDGIASAVNPTDVADVQAYGIVASDAIAYCFIRRERHHFAIGLYDLVVAWWLPLQVLTPIPLYCVNVRAVRCRRAVDNKVFDVSHMLTKLNIKVW
jgi:hypothetical protein